MARTRDRIFALVLAILFFAVSFGASFWVIWQLYKDNKEAKNVNQTTNVSTDDQTNKKDSGQKLEGTKLADFTPVEHTDSLQVTDTKVGDGEEVKPGDTVVVDYTGAVAATGQDSDGAIANQRVARIQDAIEGEIDEGRRCRGRPRSQVARRVRHGNGRSGQRT